MPDESMMHESLPTVGPTGHAALIAMIVAAGLIGGCRQELNRSHTLYGNASLPALEIEQAILPPAGEPSVTRGHDRRHWPLTTMALPARQVEHHPPYVCLVQCAADTARQRGHAPTISTALDTEPRSLAHVGESIVDLVQAAALPVSIPVQNIALLRLPWSVERGPSPSSRSIGSRDPGDPARWWLEQPAAEGGTP